MKAFSTKEFIKYVLPYATLLIICWMGMVVFFAYPFIYPKNNDEANQSVPCQYMDKDVSINKLPSNPKPKKILEFSIGNNPSKISIKRFGGEISYLRPSQIVCIDTYDNKSRDRKTVKLITASGEIFSIIQPIKNIHEDILNKGYENFFRLNSSLINCSYVGGLDPSNKNILLDNSLKIHIPAKQISRFKDKMETTFYH